MLDKVYVCCLPARLLTKEEMLFQIWAVLAAAAIAAWRLTDGALVG